VNSDELSFQCIHANAVWKHKIKTRKNAIVDYLDYQIPVTQLSQGPKGNEDMQAAKRD